MNAQDIQEERSYHFAYRAHDRAAGATKEHKGSGVCKEKVFKNGRWYVVLHDHKRNKSITLLASQVLRPVQAR